MTTFPYSTVDLTSQEISIILESFDALEKKYRAGFKMDFSFPFKKFALFENYDDYATGPVIEAQQNENPFYLTFTQVFYRFNNANRYAVNAAREYQTWCVLPLKGSYGHVLIKTETFLDKIHEMVHPIEVDFKEDASFSKRFYVMASDELLTRALLNSRFRNCLKALQRNDFWIEIVNDHLIIGNQKSIEVSTSLQMADLLNKISECIN